jgi:hypothetical protein
MRRKEKVLRVLLYLVFWIVCATYPTAAEAQSSELQYAAVQNQPTQVRNRSDVDILRRGTNSTWADVNRQDVQYGASPLKRDNVLKRDIWTTYESDGSFWSWLFGDGTRPTRTTQTNPGGLNSTFWPDFLELIFAMLRFGLWLLLAILLIGAAVWVSKKKDFHFFFRRNRKLQEGEDVAKQLAKYSDLPVELEQAVGGLRAQAAALRDQRDYSKAIVYLFSYLLVELDSASCIGLAKGKTNYRYLRELASFPSLQLRLRRVITLFEEAYFGRKTITKEQFDTVWEDLPAFEAAIKVAENQPIGSVQSAASDRPLIGAMP